MSLLDLPDDVYYVMSKWMTKYTVVMCMFTCRRLHQAFFTDSVTEQFVPQKFMRRYPQHSVRKMFLIFNDVLYLKERLQLGAKNGYVLDRYNITKKGQHLRILPRSIGHCYEVRTLNLSNNRFTKIPEELGLLSNLKELILEKNQISHIPPSICQCKHIILLNFNSNKLTELPNDIGLLTNLTELSLTDNQITHLPKSIDQCTNLHILYLSGNPISELPLTFYLLPLRNLYLDKTNIAANLSTLRLSPKLLKLNLSNNALSEFPLGITTARSLESINLSFNNISMIPNDIRILSQIWRLNLEHNQLSSFPLTICQLT